MKTKTERINEASALLVNLRDELQASPSPMDQAAAGDITDALETLTQAGNWFADTDKSELIGQAVCDELDKLGRGATFEYPGFVAVGEWSFGTAGGDWGGNNEEGTEGVALNIPRTEINAVRVAQAIDAALKVRGL